MTAAALAILLASFTPSTDPDAIHEAAVVKIAMGPAWCDGQPCETIQSRPVVSWLQGACLYIADEDDVATGEALMWIIRATKDGHGSPACTHDGGPDDCGTVEHVEEGTPCL